MAFVRQLLLLYFPYPTLISLLFAATLVASIFSTSLPGCPDVRCGNVTIPYPFGTIPGCYRDGFDVTCNDSTIPPKLFLGNSNIELLDINITSGEGRVLSYLGYACYNERDQLAEISNPSMLISGPFLFSYRRNKFTAIGCDTLAYIDGQRGNSNTSYRSGCASSCENFNTTTGDGGSCNGLGCCQTAIPPGLNNYEVQWGFNVNNAWSFNPCSYAAVMQEDWYQFRVEDLVGNEFRLSNNNSAPIVLDWAIRDNSTCLTSSIDNSDNTACLSGNSMCYNTTNGDGYLCICWGGYEGNPYIPGGCTDIDECKLPDVYPCKGICTNIVGNYMCACPSGSEGYGRTGNCFKIPLISPVLERVLIGLGACISALMGICFLIYAFRWGRRYRKEKHLYHKYYKMMDNQLRVFSKRQIETATHNFDENYILGSGGRGKVYKGVFDRNNTVAIKMSKEVEESRREEFVNEIVLLSQINHKNIVRLLGCCLDVKIPMLVYEFVPNGTLYELLHGKSKSRGVPLAIRLKIALESAEALDYLHSSISRSIIHGDVKSANILLDNEFCAKVSDFGASNIVPTDTTQVIELLQGTVGYLDPECLCTQVVTKSSDVYSFGVVVLELITRKKAIFIDETDQKQHLASRFVSMARNSKLNELLDKEIVTNDDKVIQDLQEISELAIWCLSPKGENRPTMKQVVEKLQYLVRTQGNFPGLQIGSEESQTQSLLGDPTIYTASDSTIFFSSNHSTVMEINTGSTQ